MDPSMSPEQYEQLLQQINDMLNSSRTFMAAVLSVCVWDWLVTLPTEITYVWRAPMTFVNFSFFLNRYGNLATLSMICYFFYWPNRSAEACQHVFRLEAYLPVVVFVAAEVVVIARVYAVWAKNKVILAVLCFLLAAQIVVQGWVPSRSKPYDMPPGISACIPTDDTGAFHWYYIVMIIFDSVVLVLMVFKTVQMYMTNGKNAITTVLLRDQVLFYLVTFVANLSNVIYFERSGPMDNPAFLSPLATAMISISSSRLLLNLRATNAQGNSVSYSGNSNLSSTPNSNKRAFHAQFPATVLNIPTGGKADDEKAGSYELHGVHAV